MENFLEKAGLNWNVIVEDVVTRSGLETGKIALVREDTNAILGVHGDGYYPIQNEKMLEIVTRAGGTKELNYHNGGSFKGGAKVYLQLKSNDLRLGNDLVKGYITAVNSFDGSTVFAFGNSNITISCQNTFYGAYRGLANKVKHTASAEYRIEEILIEIEKALEIEQKMFKSIKKMSEAPITGQARDWALSALLDLKGQERLGDLESLSTRKKNILEDLELSIMGETSNKGQNLWGLFSGVTHYTTHKLNGDANENKMFGIYGERERKVFTYFSELVK